MLARLVLTSCLILPGFFQVPKPLFMVDMGRKPHSPKTLR
ncbi:MAG: hypothetical protein ACJAT6_001650 [Akkermansiaceae bacterium]|jgi:hypothetical protein